MWWPHTSPGYTASPTHPRYADNTSSQIKNWDGVLYKNELCTGFAFYDRLDMKFSPPGHTFMEVLPSFVFSPIDPSRFPVLILTLTAILVRTIARSAVFHAEASKKRSLDLRNPRWRSLPGPDNLSMIRIGWTVPSSVTGPHFSVPSTRCEQCTTRGLPTHFISPQRPSQWKNTDGDRVPFMKVDLHIMSITLSSILGHGP
jgi:hypothetical protein